MANSPFRKKIGGEDDVDDRNEKVEEEIKDEPEEVKIEEDIGEKDDENKKGEDSNLNSKIIASVAVVFIIGLVLFFALGGEDEKIAEPKKELIKTVPVELPKVVSDTTPNTFSFGDENSVELNKLMNSNEITVDGVNSVTSIEITSGDYSINSGELKREKSTVKSGDKVKVHHTSSHIHGETVTTTLDIGGVKADFKSTTKKELIVKKPIIKKPIGQSRVSLNNISFLSKNNVILNGFVECNSAKTVSGFSGLAEVKIKNGEFSINGGSWQRSNSTIKNGDKIRVRHTSSSIPNRITKTILIIGGNEIYFQTTTQKSY